MAKGISKVIASGIIDSNRLRATLTLSPSPELACATLPEILVTDRLARGGCLDLTVATVRISDGTCNKPFVDAIEKPTICKATWAVGIAAWGHGKDKDLLNKLWASSFRDDCGKPIGDPWTDLGNLLEASNSGSGLQPSSELRGKKADTAAAAASAPASAAGGQQPGESKAATTTINSVLPARQSDLALLLESERALEICSTARWAHGDFLGCLAEERECAKLASGDERLAKEASASEASASAPVSGTTPVAQPTAPQKTLREQAKDRFGTAEEDVDAQYKCVFADKLTIASAPWLVDPASLADGRKTVVAALPDAVRAHVDANQFEEPTTEQYKHEHSVGQCYFAIQSSPSLARLFGLTVDLEIERTTLNRALGLDEVLANQRDTVVHFLLGFRDPAPPEGKADQGPTANFWCLVRYRPGGDMHFMPASRFEVLTDGELHPRASQYEGVLVLGQKLNAAEPDKMPIPLSRFMLTSLDVSRATNGAQDRTAIGVNKRLQDEDRVVPGPQADDPKEVTTEPLLARRPSIWARKTHSTAGLVLLDRGRLEQAVQQFAARTVHGEKKGDGHVILDSNDLLVGYRLDVGVPVKGGAGACGFSWRSLMARDVSHGDSGGSDYAKLVAATVPVLMGGSAGKRASAWQYTLDDAQLSLPVRLVASEKKTPDVKDAYVEEGVATWTGEPMAAQCAGDSKDVEAVVGAGEVISLPDTDNDKDNDRVPPPLRFGWPYRVGVRAVYAGGISLPLVDARRLYEDVHGCSNKNLLTLPARDDGRSGVRRFLRHERLCAPYLLIHNDLALPKTAPVMGYERAAHAIVRTANDKAFGERGQPEQTQRIFVPPSVERHFAALHGTFDTKAMDVPHPPHGLPGVVFNSDAGGFPVVAATSVQGINGEAFFGPRYLSIDGKERGDAVYKEVKNLKEDLGKQRHPYYPDPAAMSWVVAVRHANTNHYLHGAPVVATVRAPHGPYPYCRPLVLQIQRRAAPREGHRAPSMCEIVVQSPRVTSGHKVANAVEVVATLAPGEDFEIDVWCVPDVETLADKFAIVEGIGTLAQQRADRHADKDGTTSERLLAALETLLPAKMVHVARKCLESGEWSLTDSVPPALGNDGIGGLTAPGRTTRLAIAQSLYDTLCLRPMDEIAAVRSVRVTHATLRPSLAPKFEPENRPRSLRAWRPYLSVAEAAVSADTAASGSATAVPASSASAASSADSAASGASSNSPQNATKPVHIEYSLGGDVFLDLMTTGAIEFRARTVFPASSAFDDPRRGRSARDRRNGVWPKGGGQELTSTEVFGFDVAEDGQVTLPLKEVTLLQIEDLAQPVPGLPVPAQDGQWRMGLEGLTSENNCSAWGRVVARHIFPDRKARRLFISMRARARHEQLMRTAGGVAKMDQWLQPGKEPIAPVDKGPTEVCVWLRAGVRPSELVAHTPAPAFVWDDRGTSITRKPVIRISLGRGWFSSGEGELLGVVVWPPGSLDSEATVAKHAQSTSACEFNRDWTLPDFRDEDLGSGGRFVTRWGSDPTKAIDVGAPVETRLPGFLYPSAFKDLSASEFPTGFTARLATCVHMPLRTDSSAPQLDPPPPPLTLDVSLVTYEPRFDIETEQWYVDIDIEHQFEAQPFVRLGLVRYQPNAPEDLQVSFPATQWVQLLPRRDAWIITEQHGAERRTFVTVEGLGPVETESDGSNNGVGHRLWAHVVSEYVNDAGLPCRYTGRREVLTLEATDLGAGGAVMYQGPRRRWSKGIDIDPLVSESVELRNAKHYVYLEERESYLPATYAREPVSGAVARGEKGDGRGHHLESGPRFIARLPLQRH